MCILELRIRGMHRGLVLSRAVAVGELASVLAIVLVFGGQGRGALAVVEPRVAKSDKG